MIDVKNSLSVLPRNPGVYIYKNKEKEIIYVGKAIDLSKRVKQYFTRDDALGAKTPLLVQEIASIETIETQSEFDAILLEAKLIKEYQPKFNTLAKDDKSPLYVLLNFDDELPVVSFVRKPKNLLIGNHKKTESTEQILYFGPFQSAYTARSLMRSLRRVVPYCIQKKRDGKNCFYTHIGLCIPCPSYISKLKDGQEKTKLTKIYRQHLFRLRDILSGKAVNVIRDLEKEMEKFSEEENYEEAASLRNQLKALRQLLSRQYNPALYVQSDSKREEIFLEEQQELITVLVPYYPELKKLNRIECFDISNFQGTNATASMVVVTEGRIDKQHYRKFRMRIKDGPNDFAMMAEAVTRRFTHADWQFPDLLVIDGGKGQVSAAKNALLSLRIMNSYSWQLPPIIGLAKREEEIIIPDNENWKTVRLPFSSGALKLLQRLRDEAHRFALTYHKLLRKKAFETS